MPVLVAVGSPCLVQSGTRVAGALKDVAEQWRDHWVILCEAAKLVSFCQRVKVWLQNTKLHEAIYMNIYMHVYVFTCVYLHT